VTGPIAWRRAVPLVGLACVPLCLPAPGHARERAGTRVEFDLDRAPETFYDLTDDWSFGAIAELDAIIERNFDLDSRENADVATLEPGLELALAYEPAGPISAFTEVELRQGIVIQDEDDALDAETRLRLEQAYIIVAEPGQRAALQLGRQSFEDERDWWYDEELDALRVFFRTERLGVEFSVSRNQAFGNDFLDRSRTAESENYFLVGHYAYAEEANLSAWLVRQDNPGDGEKPVFLGARSIGQVLPGLEHWLDAAIVRGTDDGRDIRAFGFDIGAVYEPELPLQPAVTLGIAMGSGDSDGDDNVDGDFRQTGLQGSYFYYGEVLAPELSNLWVGTLGIGLRPFRNASVDLLYHSYRQHRAADEFRDVLIEEDPDGRHRGVGEALDFVVGYWGIERLYVELIVGTFFPGDAFSDSADNAFFGELIISYEF
jgi:alginate production protein